MNETLQEFVDSRGVEMRVDRRTGVIRGAKILGIHSRNGRTYRPEALIEAVGLYEEAKVNVNHPKQSPLGARDYQDRIGVLKNVAARPEEGLFADFHFNPKHALAEQLIWDAEHMPQNVGFSHNVQARTSRRGDQVVVEAITKVQSVDLVADPATTRGLFESASVTVEPPPAETGAKEGVSGLSDLTLDDLRRHRPDLIEALAQDERADLARLRSEIDRLEAARAALKKRALGRKLLSEFGLPDPDLAEGWEKSVVSERFVESLLAAPSEEEMRRMVEERAELVRGAREGHCPPAGGDSKPRSRDQNRVYAPPTTNVKAFVEAIT
jgi:hypothetical protein